MTPAPCRGLLLALLLCGTAPLLFAQVTSADSARAVAAQDSLRRTVAPQAAREGPVLMDTVTTPIHFSKSPGLAMLLSGILPGAGQAYNESYWKVPIVTGLGIYFVSSWLDNNRRYREYRDRYRESLAGGGTGNNRLLEIREFYKDQRDGFVWYFFILYVLNIVDAYVDASLYDFNVGDDLSVNFLPGVTGGQAPIPGVRLSIRFR